MLALTEDACQAVEGILEQSMPGAGIRIAPSVEDGAAGQLQMSVSPAPVENDQVIDSEGGPVFVENSATEFLDDKVLDASVSDDSVVQFEILAQA
jgi:Fe-S cluster assembly iron-binding protein IscA